jgi:hypothetical protein
MPPKPIRFPTTSALEAYYQAAHWEVAPETYRRGVLGYVGHTKRWQRQANPTAHIQESWRHVKDWETRRVAQGVASMESWRRSQVAPIPGAAAILAARKSPFKPGGIIDPSVVFDTVKQMTLAAEKAGLSVITGTQSDLLAGYASKLHPQQVLPFGEFFRGGKLGMHQQFAHPTFVPRGVAALERGEHMVSGLIPRVVTSEIAEARVSKYGLARPQEVMLRTMVLSPRSRFGQALAQGASESEIALVAQQVRGTQFIVPGSYPSRHPALRGAQILKNSVAETAVPFGRGNAALALGRRLFIGGELTPAFTEATGIMAIATMQLAKEPAFLIEGMLQNVIASSARISRSHLRGTYRAFKRQGLEMSERMSLAVLTPGKSLLELGLSYATKHIGGMRGGAAVRYSRMTREVQAVFGMRRLIRDVGRGRGVRAIETGWLPEGDVGKIFTTGWRGRGYHPAVVKGFKVDPVNLMALSAQGPASARIAKKLAAEGVRQGGERARQWMALLGVSTGRLGRHAVKGVGPGATTVFEDVGTGLRGFQKLGLSGIDPTLGTRLRGLRTAGDVRALLQSGILPKGPTLLDLPESVRLPTPAVFENAKRLGFLTSRGGVKKGYKSALQRLIRTQGVETTLLPLPSLEAELGRLVPARLADDELIRTPKAIQSLGDLFETAGKWGLTQRTGASAAGAFYRQGTQDQTWGYLHALAGHTGRGRFLSRILKPRIRTGPENRVGGMWFPQITTGFDPAKLGLGENVLMPPEMGFNELGISVEAAQRMGIKGARPGKTVYGLGQYFPSVVPGTLSGQKIRILSSEFVGPNEVVTNVANRLQAFRDLDWDQMQVALHPSSVTKRQQRLAWREASKRTARYWNAIPHAERAALASRPFESGLAGLLQRGPFGGWTEDQLVGAVRQKATSGLYYEPTMQLREAVLQRYGTKSYYGQQAIGTAYQLAAIKKGLTGQEGPSELFEMLKTIPRDLKAGRKLYIDRAEGIIARMAGSGIESDVILGLRREKGDYRRAARQLVRAAGDIRDPLTSPGSSLGRLATGEERLTTPAMITTAGRARTSVRNTFSEQLMGWGPAVHAPAEVTRSLAAANQAAQSQGAVGRAAGGLFARAERFWGNMPRSAQYLVGGVGALLGLRVVASHLFGNEPSVPSGMNISPELAARIAMQQQAGMGGAPLPPDPLVMSGIHENSMQRPYVPMSPVPARVTHPLRLSPKIHLSGSDTRNADGLGVGMHLAHAFRTDAGPPRVGIMTTEASSVNRLDLLNDRRMRQENRLHHV